VRVNAGMAAIAACLLSLGPLAALGNAGTVCESEQPAKFLPPPPHGCQWQRIQASGGLSFGVVRSAGKNAEKAWARQVVTFFGERFADWDKAVCKKVLCVEASVAHSQRCTYSGFPCASDADQAAIKALETKQIDEPEPQPLLDQRGQAPDRKLTASEIREMQELLSDAGYRVGRDGVFGDGTERALALWQRRRGLPDKANPDWQSLEDLRRLSGEGARAHRR
jgi:hypothetical protein